MSDTTNGPQSEDQIIETAKADYSAYLENFEQKFGYGIGAVSTTSLTPEGFIKVDTLMKLVKLPPVVAETATPAADLEVAPEAPAPETAETPADTTSNGDNPTTETSASDSPQQPTPEAA